jgi:hypothetical protein
MQLLLPPALVPPFSRIERRNNARRKTPNETVPTLAFAYSPGTIDAVLEDDSDVKTKRSSRRDYISELKYGEASYGQDLKLLMDNYILPIDEQEILSSAEHDQIFLGYEEIYTLHCKFLESLGSITGPITESVQTIAKLFIEYSPLFKEYSRIIANYEFARQHLHTLRKEEEKIDHFIKNADNEGVTIERLMFRPVQRLPQYVALLTELKESFKSEREALSIAVSEINATISFCAEQRCVAMKDYHTYIPLNSPPRSH